jgi:hypothetical protein
LLIGPVRPQLAPLIISGCLLQKKGQYGRLMLYMSKSQLTLFDDHIQGVLMAETQRLRDMSISVGGLLTGPLNPLTDVPGVRVGHQALFNSTISGAEHGIQRGCPQASYGPAFHH